MMLNEVWHERQKTRSRIYFLIRLAVSVGVILYLVKILEWDRVIGIVSTLDIGYLWLPPVLTVAGLFIAAARWSSLLPYFGVEQERGTSFGLYLIASFHNSVLPGVIGGDVVRALYCATRSHRPLTSVMGSVVVERMSGILMLLVMLLIGLMLVPQTVRNEVLPVAQMVAVIVGIVICLVFAIWVVRRIVRRQDGCGVGSSRVFQRVTDLANEVKAIPGSVLALVLILSMGFQLVDVIGTFILARAMHLDLSVFVLLLFLPLVYIITLLPISLGGVGVREGALTFFLTIVGVESSDAVILAFLIYLNRVLVGFVGGGLQLVWNPAMSLSGRSEE